jgi:glycogen synthase
MTADTIGGVWTYALELTRALAPHGVEVRLATMGAPLSAAQRKEVRDVANLSVSESNFKLEWMEDPWRDVRLSGEWLLRLAEQFKPDVAHLNGYAHGALDWRAPVLIVGHSCVASWWRAVKGEDAPDDWDRYRSEVARGLAAAELVIAPTRAMLDALVEHYGPPPKSRVVPNGRDTTPHSAQYGPLRRAAVFTDHPPTDAGRGVSKENLIFSAGRLWDEAKNIAALERIADRLSWPIYVAGDERGISGARRSFGNIRWLGRLSCEDMARWMARAAIYAAPARYEPFGLSALEAGLSGCALALGDIPSLREVWGEAAIFVPPDDAEALRHALEGLIGNARLRREYAARALRRALEYSPRRMADGYIAAYSELMANGTHRSNETCESHS